MKMKLARLKVLFQKQSIGGWVLLLFVKGWKLLGDWQNVEWLERHLLPQGWGGKVFHFHPDFVSVAFLIGALAWFTVVISWPGEVGLSDRNPRITLAYSPDTGGLGGNDYFVARNGGGVDAYNVQIADLHLRHSQLSFRAFRSSVRRVKRRRYEPIFTTVKTARPQGELPILLEWLWKRTGWTLTQKK